jgi:hypothetical protein
VKPVSPSPSCNISSERDATAVRNDRRLREQRDDTAHSPVESASGDCRRTRIELLQSRRTIRS